MLIIALRSFLALSRHGTIVKAADQVKRSPAAVSIQLKKLEIELGVRLFARTKRSLELTPEAKKLVPLVEQVLASLEAIRSLGDATGPPKVVSLGVIHSVLPGALPALLKSIALEHSGVEIRVVAGLSSDLAKMVENGDLDAAITNEPPEDYSTLHLTAQRLYTEPLVLVAPHSVEHHTLLETLQSYPYIAFDRTTWAGRVIDKVLLRFNVNVASAMEFNSMEAVASVVSQGFGVAILPQALGANWLDNFNIQIIPLEGFERSVFLLERADVVRTGVTGLIVNRIRGALPVEHRQRV